MILNRVTLAGYVGDDPDIRVTAESTVCSFSLAISEPSHFSPTQRRTEWHQVVAFGKIAQRCARQIKRGSHILIEGALRNNNFVDKDGVKHYREKIHLTSLFPLESSDSIDQCEQLMVLEGSSASYHSHNKEDH